MTNHRTISLIFILVLAISIVTGVTARAAIIDDFSVDSSASYNVVDVYNSGGAYNITGGQFAPTEGEVQTYFYRNTGERLGAAGGDAISFDLVSMGSGVTALGFGFGLTPTTSTRTEIAVVNTFGSESWSSTNLAGAPTGTITGLTLSSPATLGVTRETSDDTKFDYSLSGGGLSSPITGTFTVAAFSSQPVYFAILAYQAGTRADNLTFTPVPEPASLGCVMVGAGLLLRRRRA